MKRKTSAVLACVFVLALAVTMFSALAMAGGICLQPKGKRSGLTYTILIHI